ncbi:hypothetical protein J5069_21795 [Candidatus Symbiopectobacterium sp. NZEC127]|uniref:hypothetical protein n=1 Tax=Candidatus Symbiopectobacterium sp. NZEC127 TaxID=2820472 RepID=UPI002225D5FD|nr:hypothetical protein [Candidatus Symbiopectobacterium sp. NZEC127]MCW2488542.1 hypothetical protein [Candidatus Symbiopectobacterium sp. NZEC127]
MSFSNNTMIGAGISKPIRPNTFPGSVGSKGGNNPVASLKTITQAKVQFLPPPGKASVASGSPRLSTRTQNAELGAKVRNVRSGSNKNEAKSENIGASPSNTHDAVAFNNVFDSLDSSLTFINQSENDAMAFLRKDGSIEGLDKFFTVLSKADNDVVAVAKVKQIVVMLKMLSDSSTRSVAPDTAEIKKDIQFYVDNVNKHGLTANSPFAGSLLKGTRVLKDVDARVNKNAAQVIAKGLNHNAVIDRLVESKINMMQDKNQRATLLSKWKDISFRQSKQVFDRMESAINDSSHFHRLDALLNHQPIKLDLFKDFLQRENADQINDTRNTGPSKPDNGMSKETPGPTYIYNDYSTTTNDNSVHFTDNSRFSMKEAVNPPNGQEEKSPASATASATQHQNVTNAPEKQSDRDIDTRGHSDEPHGPEAKAGTSDTTANINKPSNETQTPPVTVGGNAGVDDIDGPALPREASLTPDINVELNMRTSVQRAQPPVVGNHGSPVAAHQTTYMGPFSTGRTGAAQFQQYKQSASITADSGRFNKTNASPVTPSNDAGTGVKSDGDRSPDENISNRNPHVKAGENPASDRGVNQALNAASFTRQRAQFATTLTKAKSNAAIVQSSEPQSQAGDKPSFDGYIGPNRTGRTGAAEFKRYWQSAKTTMVETNTPVGRREPLPGTNVTEAEKPVALDGSKANEKAQDLSETPSQKATTATLSTQATRQQPSLTGAAGINQQKSDIYIGPRRTGRTGAADFKKYASDSNAATVSRAPTVQRNTGRDAEPLSKEVLSNTSERRVVNNTDATTPAASGAERVVSVTQQKVPVAPETTKVETEEDVLLADTVPNASTSKEPSSAKRHDVGSSGDNNRATAAGNAPYKGPFWTGRQGATAKQSYLNTDRVTKK